MNQRLDPDPPVDDPSIGTIIMWGADVPPAGWVVCDGQTIAAADYPQAIGHAAFHTDEDGTVGVPDLRGFFVRGVEDRSIEQGAIDAGAGSRIDMFSFRKLAASVPYSIQESSMEAHQHPYAGFPVGTDSTIVSTPGFWSSPILTFAVGRSISQQQVGGGAETRPINFYLRYIIYVGGRVGAGLPSKALIEDEVPLGAIALWGGLYAPDTWLVCDGQSKGVAAGSDEAGLAKLLDGFEQQRAGTIKTPDLRGQFIRGVDGGTSRDRGLDQRVRLNGIEVGSTQRDAYQSHSHAFTQFPGQESYWTPLAQDLWYDTFTAADGPVTGWTGDAETRPLNAAFYFIMKSSRLPSERSVMPIGAIVMWPGSVGWPIGWLACDGMSYPINAAYQNLYDVISDAFRPDRVPSDPPGSNNGMFYVPDLQGMFVRGLDDSGQGRDPDAPRRTNLKDTVVGPVLGSVQGFALAGHPHSVSAFPGEVAWSGQRFGVQGFFGGWQTLDGVLTQVAGDAETRPRNTAMNFIIKYSDWPGRAEA